MHAFSWACAWNGQIIFVGCACALVHDGLICGHLLLDSDVLGGGKGEWDFLLSAIIGHSTF